MKQLDSFYINNIIFNKQYQFTSFAQYTGSGYSIQNYSYSQDQYTSINCLLSQYDTNIYRLNSQSYYVLTILKQDIGNKLLQNSIEILCSGSIYIDGGDSVLYKSGSNENYGNIFYQSGLIVITSSSLITDLNSVQ